MLRFYEFLNLSYLPLIQLEQLDYLRSLKARPAAKQIKANLNQNRLNFCDIGTRGSLPTELLGYEELLSLILFEPEAAAAAHQQRPQRRHAVVAHIRPQCDAAAAAAVGVICGGTASRRRRC